MDCNKLNNKIDGNDDLHIKCDTENFVHSPKTCKNIDGNNYCIVKSEPMLTTDIFIKIENDVHIGESFLDDQEVGNNNKTEITIPQERRTVNSDGPCALKKIRLEKGHPNKKSDKANSKKMPALLDVIKSEIFPHFIETPIPLSSPSTSAELSLDEVGAASKTMFNSENQNTNDPLYLEYLNGHHKSESVYSSEYEAVRVSSRESSITEELPDSTFDDYVGDSVLKKNPAITENVNISWKRTTEMIHCSPHPFRSRAGANIDESDLMTPLTIFRQLMSDDILEFICVQFNSYGLKMYEANSSKDLMPSGRRRKWIILDKEELLTYIGILIFMGIRPFSVVKEYWEKSMWGSADVAKQMSRDRFLQLDNCLYLWNETPDRLRNIEQFLDLFQTNFKRLYLPGRNLSIHGSVITWSGKVHVVTEESRSKMGMGIKLYALCDSETGYHLRFKIFTGDNTLINCDFAEMLPNSNITEKVVCFLVHPYINKGHTLFLDKYHHTPLISLYLKSQAGTDVVGPLRPHCKHLPEDLKTKESTNFIGESLNCRLLIQRWLPENRNAINFLTTMHNNELIEVVEHNHVVLKPKCIVDYNKNLGRIGKLDLMLVPFTVDRCRVKNWMTKLFSRILNITLHNAYVLYASKYDKRNTTNIQFRKYIVEELFARKPDVKAKPTNELTYSSSARLPHLMQSIGKSRNCWYCPRYRQIKVRKSVWICTDCNKQLCKKPCFSEFHSKLFCGDIKLIV